MPSGFVEKIAHLAPFLDSPLATILLEKKLSVKSSPSLFSPYADSTRVSLLCNRKNNLICISCCAFAQQQPSRRPSLRSVR